MIHATIEREIATYEQRTAKVEHGVIAMQGLSPFGRRRSIPARSPTAFTLVELLVVIGIIALLAGILFPTISKIRIAGQEADSRNVLNQIDQACQNYFTDFHAYPGPFANGMLDAADQTFGATVYTTVFSDNTFATKIDDGLAAGGGDGTLATVTGPRITAAENLVLGLCGGLTFDRTQSKYYYDQSSLGQGPANFNFVRPGGRKSPYLQNANLSAGRLELTIYANAAAKLNNDSAIPEFMDKFPTPMPFLYMRSNGIGTTSSAASGEHLVSNVPGDTTADYNILEILPYTQNVIGAGSTVTPGNYVPASAYSVTQPYGLRTVYTTRTIDKGNAIASHNTYTYPYDAYDYFVDPSTYDRTQATLSDAGYAGKKTRKKDSYVLVGAGRDRIYGTADDITNFGAVLP